MLLCVSFNLCQKIYKSNLYVCIRYISIKIEILGVSFSTNHKLLYFSILQLCTAMIHYWTNCVVFFVVHRLRVIPISFLFVLSYTLFLSELLQPQIRWCTRCGCNDILTLITAFSSVLIFCILEINSVCIV